MIGRGSVVGGVAAWAALGCTGEVVVTAEAERAPISALVIQERRVRAYEPVPETIPLIDGADVDVLLYDAPLAELGLAIEGDHVVLDDRPALPGVHPFRQVSAALPSPAAWLSGDRAAEVLEPRDLARLESRFASLRARRPSCPEYEKEGEVLLPGAGQMWSTSPLGEEVVVRYSSSRLVRVGRSGSASVSVALDLLRAVIDRPPDRVIVVGSVGTSSATAVPGAFELVADRAIAPRRVALFPGAIRFARGFVDGRWRLVGTSHGALRELEVGSDRSRVVFARPDVDETSRVELLDDGTVLVGGDGVLIRANIDGAEAPEVVPLEPGDTFALFDRTTRHEVMVTVQVTQTATLRWRERGREAWTVLGDEMVAAVEIVDDRIYVSTRSGLEVLVPTRSPRLCPTPAPLGVTQLVVPVGGSLAVARARTAMAPGGVLWMRDVTAR